MIAKFDINELKQILSKVERMAVSANTYPLLQCVKIVATPPDKAVFIATNTDVGIKITTKCTVEEEGTIFLHARRLASLVRQLSSGEVRFSTAASDRVAIETGGSIFKFACDDGEQYPELPVVKEGDLVISGADLHRLFGGTVWAVDDGNRRSYMGGLFLDLDRVRTVATDAKVFASQWIDMDGIEGKGILDRPLVAAVLATFNKTDEVTIGIRDNQIVFTAPDIVLVGRLIEGEFFDFEEQIFNRVAANAITMIVNRGDLAAVLRRALLFSTAANSIPKVQLALGDDLVVRSVGLMGDSEEHLDVEAQGVIELFFNARLLLNALNSYNSEKATFKFDQIDTPCSLEECDGVAGICVCMPLRP